VKKYLKKENKTPTIEKDVSYLLSKFSTIKIYNALLITVGKLDIDALTGIDELPQRKPKLIEFISKLIYNQMSIFNVSLKCDEWYVLRPSETIYSESEQFAQYYHFCHTLSCYYSSDVYIERYVQRLNQTIYSEHE
jgi:hypothetical protein